MSKINTLQKLIDSSKAAVFFGGAGVSTESGIPDFRSPQGLYKKQFKYPAELMLSHSFFVAHPDEFYDFYRERVLFLEAKPNMAHQKLAKLEKAGRLKGIITQNIDGLHQAAGSQNVLELHGSIWRNYCFSCGKTYEITAITQEATDVPRCNCGGIIRPDVVLYEEALDNKIVNEAVSLLKAADLLIVGGTSLAVYPAAGLLEYFNGSLVLINKSSTAYDERADLLISENIGEVFNAIK